MPIVAASASDADEMDEDALMQQALQLSMMDAAPTSGNVRSNYFVENPFLIDFIIFNCHFQDATPSNANSATLTDSAFVDQLLQTVDTDLNDPLIQAALNQIHDKSATEDPSKKNKRDPNQG